MKDLTMMKIMQKTKMGLDTTYKMLYTEAEYQLVDSYLKSCMEGSGLDQLGTMKPAILGTMVSMTKYQKMFPNFNPNEGLDQYVQTKSRKRGKPVLGLETVDDQIFALLGTASLEEQAENLLIMLQNEEPIKLKMMELISIYDRADLTRMQKLMYNDQDSCSDSQQVGDASLKDRNDKWIKQLPSIMKKKSSFIAVGALHLVGEVGLLNQLEKLGYKVEPVRK